MSVEKTQVKASKSVQRIKGSKYLIPSLESVNEMANMVEWTTEDIQMTTKRFLVRYFIFKLPLNVSLSIQKQELIEESIHSNEN
jgi:hypothetical protein